LLLVVVVAVPDIWVVVVALEDLLKAPRLYPSKTILLLLEMEALATETQVLRKPMVKILHLIIILLLVAALVAGNNSVLIEVRMAARAAATLDIATVVAGLVLLGRVTMEASGTSMVVVVAVVLEHRVAMVVLVTVVMEVMV
jgi:hypothetical protein